MNSLVHTDDSPTAPTRRGPEYLVLAGIVLIAVLLRTHLISEVTLSFDEACSWKISQFSWTETWNAVSRDAHPPLYYAILKAWGALTGQDAAGIRCFSVLMGAASVLAAYAFVRTALDSDESSSAFGPLLAAALVAGSALHVEMGLQARPYTLGTFLSLFSATFLIRWLRNQGTSIDWGLFTGSICLLSFTHYYCLFTVGAECLFAAAVAVSTWFRMGWRGGARRIVLGLLGSLWILQFTWSFWLPVFLDQRERSTSQLWMEPFRWSIFSATVGRVLAGGQLVSPPEAFGNIAIAAWIATVLGLVFLGNRTVRLAALCAAVPLVAVIAYALMVRNILGGKYLIFAHTFLLAGGAILAARVPWKWCRSLIAIGLCCWSTYWCLRHAEARDQLAHDSGVQDVVRFLKDRRKEAEPVIVSSHFVHPIVQFYLSDSTTLVRTLYFGDHVRDMLGGPPLRESEYRDNDRVWEPPTQCVWVVDVYNQFGEGRRLEVKAPQGWQMVGQEEYREANGIACILAVREYRREHRIHNSDVVVDTPAEGKQRHSLPEESNDDQ